MLGYFRIKNWKKHQHYNDRRPPWIKLHNSLFDDYEFQQLTDIQRWHLVAIWLLASRSTTFTEDKEPLLPDDPKYLQRQTGMEGKIDLKPLYSAGFIIRYQDASTVLADCSPETEAYRSRHIDLEETEGDTVTRTKTVRFTPPTLEEVSEYIKSRNSPVDPIKWHAHYTSNGWKVGKASMKDWRAAVVTWERREN